jgi:hypothetical protein
MKQLLVEVDDQIATALEHIAPARSRKRSEFVRLALRRALWEQEERATRNAYERIPDDRDVYGDPRAWETARAPRAARRRKK